MLTDMFGGGGSGPRFDPRVLTNIAEEGAQRQREIVGGIQPRLDPLTGTYKKAMQELPEQAAARRRALASTFQKQLGEGLQAQGTAEFNQAKQQILGAIPELQRRAREASAATGGLQRGAAAQAVGAPVAQAGEQLGGVAQNIAIQTRQAQNQALSDIFSDDRAFELQKMGIDLTTAQNLLDMGRGDILQEAASLAGIEQQRTADLLGIHQMAQEAEIARQQATQQRRAALGQALLGLGGTLGGAAIAGPLGGAAGGQMASSLNPTQQRYADYYSTQRRTGGLG